MMTSQNETARYRVLTYLKTSTGATNRQLADALQLPIDSVRRTVNKLRSENLLSRDAIYGTIRAVTV